MRQAWLDESIRFEGDGVYVLGAVAGDDAEAEAARDVMRGLLLRSERRLHWKHLDVGRRLSVAAAIADLGLTATAVVGAPVGRHAQERARRICLESLLPALSAQGVQRAWLESRTERLNRRDREFVAALFGKRLIGGAMRVGVRPPEDDPMLWIADAIAGAASAASQGDVGWLKECGDVQLMPVMLR